MTPRPGIVIRGMGLISSLGAGKSRTVEAIRGKRDGLAPAPFFPHPASENAPVCSIRDFPPDLEHRCDELAMVAIEEALAEAGIAPGSGELASCALLLGNTSVDLLEYECQFRRHVRDGSPGPAPLDRHGAILGHLADRVAVIAAGVIVAEGTPADIGGRAEGEATVSFGVGEAIAAEDLPPTARAGFVQGSGRVIFRTGAPTAALHEITGWAVQRGLELEHLTVERPSLEDVYLRLVGEGNE